MPAARHVSDGATTHHYRLHAMRSAPTLTNSSKHTHTRIPTMCQMTHYAAYVANSLRPAALSFPLLRLLWLFKHGAQSELLCYRFLSVTHICVGDDLRACALLFSRQWRDKVMVQYQKYNSSSKCVHCINSSTAIFQRALKEYVTIKYVWKLFKIRFIIIFKLLNLYFNGIFWWNLYSASR